MPRVRSSRIFLAAELPIPRPPTSMGPRTARWTKTVLPSLDNLVASLLSRQRFRKRKRALYRSFLVSLETRKRKIRRNLIRTKELRHDQEFLGDSGSNHPRGRSLPLVVFPGKADSDCRRFR